MDWAKPEASSSCLEASCDARIDRSEASAASATDRSIRSLTVTDSRNDSTSFLASDTVFKKPEHSSSHSAQRSNARRTRAAARSAPSPSSRRRRSSDALNCSQSPRAASLADLTAASLALH